jgi:hypothetical protein
MPLRRIVESVEEWEKLTGERGSVRIFVGAPVKRPPQRRREVERDIEMTEYM